MIRKQGDNYYVVTNPARGTAVTHVVSGSFAATSALFLLGNPSTSGKLVILEHLRLLVRVAPGGTVLREEFLAVVSSTTRSAASGNLLQTPKAVTSGNASVTTVQSFAGDLQIDGEVASSRTVSRCTLHTNVPLVGDELLVVFGANMADSTPLTAARATAPARFVGLMGPVVALPGENIAIHRFGSGEATTAPQFEYELCWRER